MIEPPQPENRLSRHLVLIGPAGAGKSTIGRAVALDRGAAFVDLDDHIELSQLRSVGELFDIAGEAEFRKLESRATVDLLAESAPLVLSTGGGAIVSEAVRQRLMSPDVTVALIIADPSVLATRIGNAATARPLYAEDPLGATQRLLAERRGWYEAVADVRIDSGVLSIAEAVERLVQWLDSVSVA